MQAVIVKIVKMMNCHVWYVKVKETVSDSTIQQKLTSTNNDKTD